MVKDLQARQLIKQVPPLSATLNFEGADEIIINPAGEQSSGEGWEVVQPFTNSVLYCAWRGYIDLAGYSKDDLTFFTQAVDIQHGPIDITSVTVLNTTIVDLVTTRRIPDEDIGLYVGFLDVGPLPGAQFDLQEVIYGEWESKVPYSTDFPTLRTISADSFGSGNASAADRLHITRIVLPSSAVDGAGVYLAGTNFIIGGTTGKEKDLVYIERLRRSYTQERP